MADTELKVRITGDLTAIRNSLKGLEQQLAQVGQQANRAGAQASRGLGQFEGIAGRATAALKGFVAAFVGIEGLRGFIRVADQAAVLNARIRLATRGQDEFNRAYDETFRIAQRTRTPLAATVDLFTRLERSTRDLDVSQDTLFALTETINQAAQISGGGAGAEAALFQLSQGLAAGQLRGEELNSVLEQTPRLAQAIADGLNLPIGKLREYAQEGKLTAAEVARALLASREQVASEFAEMPRTVGGAFTQLANSVGRIIERLNKDTNLTGLFTGLIDAAIPALEGLATLISSIVGQFREAAGVVRDFFEQFKNSGSEASRVVGDVADASDDLWSRFKAELQILPQSIRTVFTILLGEAQKRFAAIQIAVSQLGGRFATTWAGVRLSFQLAMAKVREIAFDVIGAIGSRLAETQRNLAGFAQAAGFEGLAAGLNRAADGFGGLGQGAQRARQDAVEARDEYSRTIASIEQQVAAFQREMLSAIAGADAAIQGSLEDRERALADLKKGADEAAEALGQIEVPDPAGNGAGAAVANQAALLKDAIERSLKELQRLYDAGEIGLRDYYRERQRLQLALIDAQIAEAEAELRVAKTQEQQAAALTKIAILQRDRAEVGPAIAREQAAAEEELARRLEDVQDRLAELQGDTTASQRRALEREREELLQRFREDPEASALIDRLFDVELARTRASAIRDQARALTDELRSIEENAAVQVEAGLLGQIEGERRVQEARQQTLRQLEDLRLKLLEVLAANPEDAEAQRALRDLDTEIGRVRASSEQLRQQAMGVAQSSFATFFDDLASGAKSAKDAFLDLVKNFVQGLARMAAEALAKRAALALFGEGSFLGGLFGAKVFHAGGRVGQGGASRMLPAAAVAGLLALGAVPRYHNGTGGPLGLAQDERLAILQTGETVLSRQQTAALGEGDRPAPGIRVVNAFDPSFVPDQMDSAEGERVILNVIGRNPGRIRQLISAG